MSSKRSRAAYETDLQRHESPYVFYGTALPHLDADARDDGSYVPLWKQEVTDEHGRKRLHGAFTGGWSAGYFNTVGSKEGWTPSTFVSSRSKRSKDEKTSHQQRPEDFMDEEDLAEAAESQKLQTAENFAGFGSTGEDQKRKGLLMDLFKTEGDTMGVTLLRKMGWRDGQGVGPRIRRKANLDGNGTDDHDDNSEAHYFAPENSPMITFLRKSDKKGLGWIENSANLKSESMLKATNSDMAEDETSIGTNLRRSVPEPESRGRTGIGTGILNDTGSDDDDPYEVGPKISYHRVIGGEKKKKIKDKSKQAKTNAVSQANNIALPKPIFVSKRNFAAAFRKCQDGRLPLGGFELAEALDELALDHSEKYARPEVPESWQPTLPAVTGNKNTSLSYTSTADAAKASSLDARSRAAILGEAQLPGKSVFDFLSPAQRDRIASATGKTNLPAGLGESLPVKEFEGSEKLRFDNVVPELDKDIALAGLGRGVGGWMPYADDFAKRDRYRTFLEYRGGLRSELPRRPPHLSSAAWLQELQEFVHAAEVFKPMSGPMASRFTTSSIQPTGSFANKAETDSPLLSKPADKPEDPAEVAARMGMFGPMTRSVETFYPTRLVCKRFNVKPPDHVQPDVEGGAIPYSSSTGRKADLVNKEAMDKLMAGRSSFVSAGQQVAEEGSNGLRTVSKDQSGASSSNPVNAERNEALEGPRPGDAVFKAIFGSDDEDD